MQTAVKGLSERAQKHLDTFVSAANEHFPHPKDDERFYAFIRACHLDRVETHEGDVRSALVAAGFPEEVADDLSSTYCSGRAILKPLDFEDVDR